MLSLIERYCSEEWRAFLDFHSEIMVFQAKDFIVREGDSLDGLHMIEVGKVKVTTFDNLGGEHLIRLSSNGEFIGHRGFGKDWKYPISAIALEETKVKFIPIKVFDQLVKSNLEFTYHLMLFFAEELRDSEERRAIQPVKNQLAKAVLYNYNAFGFKEGDTILSYTLSRKDFASMLNITYESVVRALSKLKTEKVIDIEGKDIRILDLIVLQQLAK